MRACNNSDLWFIKTPDKLASESITMFSSGQADDLSRLCRCRGFEPKIANDPHDTVYLLNVFG